MFDYAKKIREYRERKFLTQEELAKCRCDCGNIVELTIFVYLPLYILGCQIYYDTDGITPIVW